MPLGGGLTKDSELVALKKLLYHDAPQTQLLGVAERRTHIADYKWASHLTFAN